MKILVIPDLHAPFQHSKALDFLKRTRDAFKTTAVVCIGDLGDQHGWSRHGKEPDAVGQACEDDACLEFCDRLYTAFPTALACVGNHDSRLAKACVRVGVPSRLHRTVGEVYASPKAWKWDTYHLLDGVAFQHGEGFSGKDCAIRSASANRKPTVVGHIHSAAGVQYASGPYDTIWGLAVGCLIDANAVAFTYGRKSAARPVLGCGVVLDGVPHFIPMR